MTFLQDNIGRDGGKRARKETGNERCLKAVSPLKHREGETEDELNGSYTLRVETETLNRKGWQLFLAITKRWERVTENEENSISRVTEECMLPIMTYIIILPSA